MLNSPNSRSQESRAGQTQELLHVAISISNPKQKWVVSREPVLNIAFALAEVIWIISGRRDLRFLEYWNRGLSKFVGSGPNTHGAYGYRLREHLGIDQLQQAYDILSSNPDSRQVVLQIWDSAVDAALPDGTPADQDIPCNIFSMIKVRDEKLQWTQITRSHDLFLGMPYNFVQFISMQEILAGWLGVEVGTFTQFSDSLHIYERHSSQVQKSLSESLPFVETSESLALPRQASVEICEEMEKRIEMMTSSQMSGAGIRRLSKWDNAPTAYRNMLNILAAEALRRRGLAVEAEAEAERCTNTLYRDLWKRWHQRTSGRIE